MNEASLPILTQRTNDRNTMLLAILHLAPKMQLRFFDQRLWKRCLNKAEKYRKQLAHFNGWNPFNWNQIVKLRRRERYWMQAAEWVQYWHIHLDRNFEAIVEGEVPPKRPIVRKSKKTPTKGM